MKQFGSYVYARRRAIFMGALMAAVYAVCFALYHLPIKAVLYPTALAALLAAVFAVLDFLRYRKTYRTLEQLRRQTENLVELLPKADGPVEQAYQGLIAELCQKQQAAQAAELARYGEMADYYTLWAHQIKTPIAAMKLALENEDSALSRQLSAELLRIEQYVELVMAFLRLDSTSTDYVFRPHRLDDILRPCLRRMAPSFIAKGLTLEYEPAEQTLVTDEKWLSVVVEQVLANALKYTRRGSIRLWMADGQTLCIRDTGMGIAPEDLPRVFERGFTGCNGRRQRSSSGIGLYLCRRICANLGVEISISSRLGEETTVSLRFRQKSPQGD